ncbi:MAG: hypothetical protein PSX36_11275 [bacterium]|nr:hypothetical protein [bacterium]
MDIINRLNQEHSIAVTRAIVNYVGEDAGRFAIVLNAFLHGDARLSQRAGWPLGYIAMAHPGLIRAHIVKLLKKLEEKGNHPAVPRNIFRILQSIDIPKKHQGNVLDLCFKIIPSELHAVGVRAFAITTAATICKQYPDLKRELQLVLSEMAALPQSPAIVARIKFAVKDLAPRNSKL